jgi:hypothetical protein
MLKKLPALAVTLAAALALFSCTTVKYLGPLDHVDYRNTEKIKSSRQSSALKDGADSLVNTYDEDYFYDDKGNIIKTTMTEYIERLGKDKKYIVWDTESKVLGGKLVPYRVSVNGVAFMEIEYDLLTVAGSGEVKADISERNFVRIRSTFMAGTDFQFWGVALDNYSVGFPSDDKFVKAVRRFDSDKGTYLENILTLGFDNIVLKRFHFSRESLANGVAKSYTGYNFGSQVFKQLTKGQNVDYTYEWKVIANKICQAKTAYEARDIKLSVEAGFDAAGKRIGETWFLTDPRNKDDQPRKVFEQTITY